MKHLKYTYRKLRFVNVNRYQWIRFSCAFLLQFPNVKQYCMKNKVLYLKVIGSKFYRIVKSISLEKLCELVPPDQLSFI